jgi:anaerobic ribonucleoside-triphosphate reductase
MSEEKLGKGVQFERIRRITGYLVGTLDRWNNAKRQEEKDRVVHKVVTKNERCSK